MTEGKMTEGKTLAEYVITGTYTKDEATDD